MRRAIRSTENLANRRSRKQNIDSAYDYVVYGQVKTALWESQADEINKELTNDNVRLRALRLAGSSASASDSDNLVFTES